jgi:hypothetical protein
MFWWQSGSHQTHYWAVQKLHKLVLIKTRRTSPFLGCRFVLLWFAPRSRACWTPLASQIILAFSHHSFGCYWLSFKLVKLKTELGTWRFLGWNGIPNHAVRGKKAALNDLGFAWNAHHKRPTWEESLGKLIEYKKQFGDCLVCTHRYEDDPALGRWIGHQRIKYKKRTTKDSRKKAALNDLGFVWTALHKPTDDDDDWRRWQWRRVSSDRHWFEVALSSLWSLLLDLISTHLSVHAIWHWCYSNHGSCRKLVETSCRRWYVLSYYRCCSVRALGKYSVCYCRLSLFDW